MSGQKALLFINGTPPRKLPSLADYDLIGCTDGALRYLLEKNLPLEKLTFISGDFDSLLDGHNPREHILHGHILGMHLHELRDKYIHTPDQNYTDFYKALKIFKEKEIRRVDIYGASGGEQDHFLGNLSVAYRFKDHLTLTFYDEYSEYFFLPPYFEREGLKGRVISLIPFPYAKGVTTRGLKWPLDNERLDITQRIGIRNMAIDDTISCRFTEGGILLFIGAHPTE